MRVPFDASRYTSQLPEGRVTRKRPAELAVAFWAPVTPLVLTKVSAAFARGALSLRTTRPSTAEFGPTTMRSSFTGGAGGLLRGAGAGVVGCQFGAGLLLVFG